MSRAKVARAKRPAPRKPRITFRTEMVRYGKRCDDAAAYLDDLSDLILETMPAWDPQTEAEWTLIRQVEAALTAVRRYRACR